MIQPLQIKLVAQERGERIEIASGDFLGHEVGTLSCAVDASAERIPNTYSVNNRHFVGFTAALNACMSEAYAYVAAQTSAIATDEH